MSEPVKVLIVDDSALVRQLLSRILESDPELKVVGVATDPYMAREKIKQLNPDVLTLDVEMPRMDGVTFLRNVMRLRPMPVVMVSSLTEKGADVTLEALEYGAVDFVTKPKVDLAATLEDYSAEIIKKVKIASHAKVKPLLIDKQDLKKASLGNLAARKHFKTTDKLIAIGASTGGTEAIREVLSRMPADCPGIVITQHIPAAFSLPFARRLNGSSALNVDQAEDGQQILNGHAYVAPGDRHLRVVRDGARFIIRLDDGEPVNRHKPSVDVMFDSVAQNVGINAVAALLTGMGADGARGMKRIMESGAPTVAQDEPSSVVWGMPGEAVKLGAAQYVLPLHDVAAKLLDLASDAKQS